MRFVTVVYPPELGMLRLQARSFDKFVAVQDVTEIVVILNGATRRDVDAGDWGKHKNRVTFVMASSVCPSFGASGYIYQQMLKLAIHPIFGGRPYTVLDAKNFFLRPYDPGMLYDIAGRPWLPLLPYSPDNMGALAAAEYRASLRQPVRPYEPSILTPQIFVPEVVRETLRRFPLEDMPKRKTCSEFMAYGVTAQAMDAHRNTMTRFVHLLRGDDAGRLYRLEYAPTPMAGVHRLFYERASVNQLATFDKFLRRLDLQ